MPQALLPVAAPVVMAAPRVPGPGCRVRPVAGLWSRLSGRMSAPRARPARNLPARFLLLADDSAQRSGKVAGTSPAAPEPGRLGRRTSWRWPRPAGGCNAA